MESLVKEQKAKLARTRFDGNKTAARPETATTRLSRKLTFAEFPGLKVIHTYMHTLLIHP
jgi:hypothetical protein